jgi:hypothetical protein
MLVFGMLGLLTVLEFILRFLQMNDKDLFEFLIMAPHPKIYVICIFNNKHINLIILIIKG